MKSSEDSFHLHCPTFLLIKTSLQSPSSRSKIQFSLYLHDGCKQNSKVVHSCEIPLHFPCIVLHTAQLLPPKQNNCFGGDNATFVHYADHFTEAFITCSV